jgi:hypothetical protein
METVYQLRPNELTEDFFKTIKDLYGDKEIKITIETPIEMSVDETAFLLQHEVNRNILLERIAAVKQGKIKHTLTLDEVEKMA